MKIKAIVVVPTPKARVKGHHAWLANRFLSRLESVEWSESRTWEAPNLDDTISDVRAEEDASETVARLIETGRW